MRRVFPLPGCRLGPPRTLSGRHGGDRGGTPSLRNVGNLSFVRVAFVEGLGAEVPLATIIRSDWTEERRKR